MCVFALRTGLACGTRMGSARIVGEQPRTMAHENIHATVERGASAPKLGLAALVLQHGSMEVEYYAPRGRDTQMPHDRDELYVVISGHGWFRNGEVRHEFSPGDVLFVPAKAEHRFEQFSEDFATWVVFWGPKGGEHE